MKGKRMIICCSGWFGFWLFVTVYSLLECIIYLKGHDTLLWQHKTAAELQLQQQTTQQKSE